MKTRAEPEKEDQYLVKWVGWSHLHNTWETGEWEVDFAAGSNYFVASFGKSCPTLDSDCKQKE